MNTITHTEAERLRGMAKRYDRQRQNLEDEISDLQEQIDAAEQRLDALTVAVLIDDDDKLAEAALIVRDLCAQYGIDVPADLREYTDALGTQHAS